MQNFQNFENIQHLTNISIVVFVLILPRNKFNKDSNLHASWEFISYVVCIVYANLYASKG
jgi:hypothetical protein